MDATTRRNSFFEVIFPIILSVFAVYLTIGMMLGILPDFVHNGLKFDNWVVGLVIGLESVGTLLTRAFAGKFTDTSGAKKSCNIGSLLILIASMLYTMATLLGASAVLTLSFLICVVLVQGISESMLVTGALTWGIGLAGFGKSGKVMTWNGIAMYAGIAIGAPLSIVLQKYWAKSGAFAAIALLAAVSWLSTIKIPALPVDASYIRTPFYKVIGRVSGQGLGLAFSSIGFTCISSFIALLFADTNWENASAAFVAFGVFYVLTRLFFASSPDKFGGYKVALVSLVVEIIGQLLIGFSSSEIMAIIGCSLTGIGFSLIFPALGVLAMQKISPQMRGTALGAYSAFFDLSLGLATPVAGLIAGWFSYQAVYIFGAASGLLAMTMIIKGSE